MNQTAGEGTQVPVRRNLDEEEFQEDEDLFSILEDERQHWCEVEKLYDQMGEVKSCASASNMEKEVSWASSQARMVHQEGMPETKKISQEDGTVLQQSKLKTRRNVEWRNLMQTEMNSQWRELRKEMEEEVLERYGVEEGKRVDEPQWNIKKVDSAKINVGEDWPVCCVHSVKERMVCPKEVMMKQRWDSAANV